MTTAFDQRLRLYMKVLVADIAAVTDGTSTDVGNLGEPQFQIPLSGWYWQIVKVDQEKSTDVILRVSRSLFSTRLPYLVSPLDPARQSDTGEGYLAGPDGRRLRMLEQLIDLGDDNRYYISVGGNSADIDAQTRSFNTALILTFLLLGMALVASTIIQVRFGLQPLARLRRGLEDIRRGEADSIGETFPDEVAPLAQELNQLVEANRDIVNRARMQVGNLAHALKTPLSVLVNEASGDQTPLADKLREQTAVMKDQVQYYLDRARAATRAATIGSVTDVDPVIAAFLRTFPKIYRDRNLSFAHSGVSGLRFRGERQDFEDMVGNLVDNAGKWASSRVEITVAQVASDMAAAHPLRIIIDDDGPGLPPEGRIEATRRGRRLDETRPGSGLGLSIVVDLAGLYHGRFELEESPLGGLRAVLTLPSV
ncbi:MAG TPA: sensor histidine kinase [Beijerinckiaceae bacterium]|nr:sensor histidine kinase [Beijerinckiaceae bacterium]